MSTIEWARAGGNYHYNIMITVTEYTCATGQVKKSLSTILHSIVNVDSLLISIAMTVTQVWNQNLNVSGRDGIAG